MADKTFPLGESASGAAQHNPQLLPTDHLESAEWLRNLGKLRAGTAAKQMRAQASNDVYYSYLRHKIKALSLPSGPSSLSATPTLANLQDRALLFLDKTLLKVLPPSYRSSNTPTAALHSSPTSPTTATPTSPPTYRRRRC
jgi:hypothetical protein